MRFGEINHALKCHLSLTFVRFKRLNNRIQNKFHQRIKVVDDALIFDTVQKGSSCLKSSNSYLDVGVLKTLFKDAEETRFVLDELFRLEMALREDLEYVHGKLLADVVISLSPLHEEVQKLLILSLEGEDLGKNVTLSLEQKKWLSFEVKRLHDGSFHLLVVRCGNSLAVVEEVFLEKDARNLSDLKLLTSHVADEKAKQSSWV